MVIGGATLGVMLTWPVSGYITEHLGWRWAFYASGVLAMLMTVIWFITVRNRPAEHPWITEKERDYIETSMGDTVSSMKVMMELFDGAFMEL